MRANNVYARIENGSIVEFPIYQEHIGATGRSIEDFAKVVIPVRPQDTRETGYKAELTVQSDELVTGEWVSYEKSQAEIDTWDQQQIEKLESWRKRAVVSRFQARAALHIHGVLSDVEAAIQSADPIAQMAWADAQEFRRDSPTIAAIAAALGWEASFVDTLFITAGGVTA